MEAFSDGVLAICIAIMVLEMKVADGEGLATLQPLVPVPVLLSYVLSFIYMGIYWNNHHHLLHATKRVSGGVLWANLHLLFWLSLFPFVTGWMCENHFAPLPTAMYGGVLLMAAIAYSILVQTIIAADDGQSLVARAIGRDLKGYASIVLYAIAIPLAFVAQWLSQVLYVLVALLWLVPDRRIEKRMVD